MTHPAKGVLEVTAFVASRVRYIRQSWQRTVPPREDVSQQIGQHLADRALAQFGTPCQKDGCEAFARTIEHRHRGCRGHLKEAVLVLAKRDSVTSHSYDRLAIAAARIRQVQYPQQFLDLSGLTMLRQALADHRDQLSQAFDTDRDAMFFSELLQDSALSSPGFGHPSADVVGQRRRRSLDQSQLQFQRENAGFLDQRLPKPIAEPPQTDRAEQGGHMRIASLLPQPPISLSLIDHIVREQTTLSLPSVEQQFQQQTSEVA